MKRNFLWLLVGALWNVFPAAAQIREPHPAVEAQSIATPVIDPNGAYTAAQKTWNDVRQQTSELDVLIAMLKFEEIHDAALSLRDTVRELRFGWKALSVEQTAKVDEGIRKIDGLLDSLHEFADHNDPKGVAKDQRTLHVLLDAISNAFPRGTLKEIGPLMATGMVKDPYCRMTVDPATAAARVAVGGQTYFFCSKSEAEAFKKNPAPYTALYDELTFGPPKVFAVHIGTPGKIIANQPATLAFSIREKGKNVLTTKFQPVHEKLMHLILVSDDLRWFAHEHPQIAKDGRFYIQQRFPRDGRYFLYTDFTPANGTNQVLGGQVRVGSGITRVPQKLVPDATFSKVVDGVKVDLKLSSALQAGKQVLVTYTLSKGGKPITDMTPYLAAMGHMMAISANGKEVVHTHAVSTGSDPRTGLTVTSRMVTAKGPTETFKLELPTGGLYKIWAQFGVNGHVLTVPFTFDVKEHTSMKVKNHNQLKAAAFLAASAPMTGMAVQASPKDVQNITVVLPQDYKNRAATVKAGQHLALTFFLKSDAGCGNSISVPDAHWNQTLRVGEKATVLYTPKKSGFLSYTCPMGMYKGTISVK